MARVSVRNLDFSNGSWFVLSWYQKASAFGPWERKEFQTQDRDAINQRMRELGDDILLDTSCVDFREYEPPEKTGAWLSQYEDPPYCEPGTGIALGPNGSMIRLGGYMTKLVVAQDDSGDVYSQDAYGRTKPYYASNDTYVVRGSDGVNVLYVCEPGLSIPEGYTVIKKISG